MKFTVTQVGLIFSVILNLYFASILCPGAARLALNPASVHLEHSANPPPQNAPPTATEPPTVPTPETPTPPEISSSSGKDNVDYSLALKPSPTFDMTFRAAEEGWDRLGVSPHKTASTVYEGPKADMKVWMEGGEDRYARSWVPKSSWKIKVSKDKWVTMEEIIFAYDLWFEENHMFSYTSWMGVYSQQDPNDMNAIQEMIWRVKPDLIVEMGTNTGGSAIFYSTLMRGYNPNGKIVTLDVKPLSNWDTKANSKWCPGCKLASAHPYWSDGMITFIQGRIDSKEVNERVERDFVSKAKTVVVIEDALHTEDSVVNNVAATWKWVTPNSYLLVQDTKMDRYTATYRKWAGKVGGGYRGPMRAVDRIMQRYGDKFFIDRQFEYMMFSQHHRGFLRRKKD